MDNPYPTRHEFALPERHLLYWAIEGSAIRKNMKLMADRELILTKVERAP